MSDSTLKTSKAIFSVFEPLFTSSTSLQVDIFNNSIVRRVYIDTQAAKAHAIAVLHFCDSLTTKLLENMQSRYFVLKLNNVMNTYNQ